MNTTDISSCNQRIDFLDVAKGLLIMSVVLSHSEFKYAQYIYWFHMPAFFIISGLLFKNRLNLPRQILKFFIPYISFSLVDIIFTFCTNPQDLSTTNFITYLFRHIYSGKAVPGVFWFIPCLFISKVLFYYLNKHTTKKILILIISSLYILSHIYSIVFIPESITELTSGSNLPWNIDVVPMCLFYYAVGYFMKKYIYILKSKTALKKSFILCIIIFILNPNIGVYYYLNLKFSYYKFIVFDVIIPIVFSAFIISFSYHLRGILKKLFSSMGRESLIIMYLHKPLVLFLLSKFEFGWFLYLIIGSFIPYLFAEYIINKFEFLQFIFKGKLKPHKHDNSLAQQRI